jgi:hypothetical protein
MIDNKVLYKVTDSEMPEFWWLGVCVVRGDSWIGFHDTQRGHTITGELIAETPDGFTWQRKRMDEDDNLVDDGVLTFKVLTLEGFNAETRDQVTGDLPEFSSDQQLWEWYRRKYEPRGSHW